MLDSPGPVYDWAVQLADLVAGVETRLIAEIAASVAKDQGASRHAVQRLADVAAMRAQLAQIMGEDWQQVLDQAQYVLDQARDAGQGMAEKDLAAYAPTGAAMVGGQTRYALGIITQDTMLALNTMGAVVLRNAVDEYQRLMAQPVANLTAGAVTRLQATQDALTAFADRGIDGFTDRSGRRWHMDTYAEMAVRTGGMNALRYGYERTLTSRGEDLVLVSGHGYTCDKCAPWEGKILSLTGAHTPGWHMVENSVGEGMVPVYVAATMDEARAQGLHHPNCAHSESLYLPGASTIPTPTGDGNPVVYNASQTQRALEREVRKEKRKLAAAITPDAQKEARAAIRAAQASIRDLVDTYPQLQRQRYREAVPSPSGYKRNTRTPTRSTWHKQIHRATDDIVLNVAKAKDPESVIARVRRLTALKSDFSAIKDEKGHWIYSEVIDDAEIDFIVRLERAGELVQWIGRDLVTFTATNDFRWTRGGYPGEWELKSPKKDKYKGIADRITDDARKGKKQFIIDMGTRKLSNKLRRQLEAYNLRAYPIERLLIMHSDGIIEEITLKA